MAGGTPTSSMAWQAEMHADWMQLAASLTTVVTGELYKEVRNLAEKVEEYYKS